MRLSGKLTGFVVLLSAAALMAALSLASYLRPAAGEAGFGLIVVIAVGGGLLCGLVFRVWVASRTDAEVDRLRRHVEGMGQSGVPPSIYRPLAWTQSLYEAINSTFSHLRLSVEKLETKRREMEIQIRIAQAELQDGMSVLHAISDAVVVTDAFNELSLANPSAARILHFDPVEDDSQPIDRFLSDPMLVKLIKDTREIGNTTNARHVEHRMAPDGSPRVYDVALSCMANGQKEVSGVVTILRDITHAKEVAEMKSDFVSGVSHELRTPLSSIKAYIEMLVDGEAADQHTRTEFYNVIQSETNRLSRLIDNILDISRIESGIIRVQREDISLTEVLRDVVEIIHPQARAKSIELIDEATPLDCRIYGDRDMICQALLNIFSNAVKYTQVAGRITTRTAIDPARRQVAVEVSDTGIGIPETARPHVFEKFYRVADHKSMAQGTGLGLNLVKHIIERVHEGQVTVHEGEEGGSAFRVVLPMSERSVIQSGQEEEFRS